VAPQLGGHRERQVLCHGKTGDFGRKLPETGSFAPHFLQELAVAIIGVPETGSPRRAVRPSPNPLAAWKFLTGGGRSADPSVRKLDERLRGMAVSLLRIGQGGAGKPNSGENCQKLAVLGCALPLFGIPFNGDARIWKWGPFFTPVILAIEGSAMSDIQLVCSSPMMRKIAETVRRSRTRPLLLTGETGVGKDALARWAHSISPLRDGPFVAINCAAIQESLWESEIFGHAKGAFTGAMQAKPGQIERATGGTLFLNEIGEMPLSTQAKLLTFLDTGEFQRVGEAETRSIDARIIAATNQDLERAIRAGRFRQDLFYRLASVHARIPPLRERPDDIRALARTHLQRLVRDRGTRAIDLPRTVQDLLVRHPWRGNVRELYSVLETALERCLEADDRILHSEYFFPELNDNPHLEEGGRDSVDSENAGWQDVRTPRTPMEVETSPAIPGGNGADPFDFPYPQATRGSILEDSEALRRFLDRIRTPAGRWNLSAAHRMLSESGKIRIGRRAFADRVKRLFPNHGDD